MKREPLIYAVLLVAAFALAFRTWTSYDRGDFAPGAVQPWHESADAFLALDYTRPGERLEIRRVGPSDSTYFWATTDTAAFVVGEDARKRLLTALATPHALRDLGVPDAAARRAFGLDTARARLVVHFRDGSRDLLLGARTYFTGDRYVLDRNGGHVYVLSGSDLAALDQPLQMLPERRMHAFPIDHVAAVTLRGTGRSWSMHRLGAGAGAAGAPGAGATASWAPVAGPQRPDAAFGTFMQRLQELWSAGYASRVDARTLTPVFRMEYADSRGRPLGFLELFRRPGSGSTPEYFARTELTHVLVRLFPGVGDNLAADVAQGL